MAMVGANLPSLAELHRVLQTNQGSAEELKALADKVPEYLDGISTEINAAAENAEWKGVYADKFREWQQQNRADLERFRTMSEDMAGTFAELIQILGDAAQAVKINMGQIAQATGEPTPI